jgi:hypothetical protein
MSVTIRRVALLGTVQLNRFCPGQSSQPTVSMEGSGFLIRPRKRPEMKPRTAHRLTGRRYEDIPEKGWPRSLTNRVRSGREEKPLTVGGLYQRHDTRLGANVEGSRFQQSPSTSQKTVRTCEADVTAAGEGRLLAFPSHRRIRSRQETRGLSATRSGHSLPQRESNRGT